MKIFYFSAKYLSEIIAICLLLYAFQSYLGFEEVRIRADGVGYYDYLPSIFIRGDMVRKDSVVSEHPRLYGRYMDPSVFVDINGLKVNKYTCGTAVLISPFFFGNYLYQKMRGRTVHGYEISFNFAVFLASLFYLFLTLLFLKGILRLYDIDFYSIFLAQILLVLATSVTFYTNHESAFSHIFSLCTIGCFIYLVKGYFTHQRLSFLLSAAAVLGLIFLLRQINVLIIFFVPFLAGSFQNLKSGLMPVFKSWKMMFYLIFIFGSVVFVQCFLWYLQCGSFVVYSYQNEGFNFLKPEMVNILFSYKKGLFLYTPILFISLGGLIRYLFQRNFYAFFTWLFFFLLLTYFLSSWYCWYYSCSYGLRAFIDFYTIFFILFAVFIKDLKLYFKIPVLFLSVFFIALNLVQTFQYQTYILHWFDMNREKYWTVFMRTSERYKGLVWKKEFYMPAYKPYDDFKVKDTTINALTGQNIFKLNAKTYPKIKDLRLIRIYLKSEFREKEKSYVIVQIKDTVSQRAIFYFGIPFVQFQEIGLNKYQRGVYTLDTPPYEYPANLELTIFVNAAGNKVKIEDMNIILFKQAD